METEKAMTQVMNHVRGDEFRETFSHAQEQTLTHFSVRYFVRLLTTNYSNAVSICRRKKRSFKFREGFILFSMNVGVILATFGSGLLTYESSVPAIRQTVQRSALFPIYFPHALGLSIVSKLRKSVVVGIFIGFYLTRLHTALRSEAGLTSSRAGFLFAMAGLGTSQIYFASYFLRKWLCRDGTKQIPSIDSVKEALLYLGTTCFCTLLFGTLIALVQCSGPMVEWDDFSRIWATDWLGAVAGFLTVSPAVTSFMVWEVRPSMFRPRKILESVLLSLVTAALLIILFLTNFHVVFHPLPYLLFPVIIISAFRFNRVGCAVLVLVASYICSWASIRKKGSLYRMAGSPTVSSPKLILQVELFVSVLGVVGIFLSAAVREKKQLSRELHHMNAELENAVRLRTQELVKANEELQESQRKAERASHAKSDFLANMSHEIRTPIHGIMGLTALLLESELTEDQRDSLMSVKECANLLLHIINSILDLAKIEAGRLELEYLPFSVCRMVVSTTRMLQTRAQEKGLQLLWDVDSRLPDILVGDYGKIQQCLLNLVGNAVKFTHEGSVTVRVTLSQVSGHKEHGFFSPEHCSEDQSSSALASEGGASLFVPLSQFCNATVVNVSEVPVDWKFDPLGKNNKSSRKSTSSLQTDVLHCREGASSIPVAFEVRDTGIGISQEKLLDIFKPFAQADASTSRVYGGTGLGLCIVQRFVELLGGELQADSELGKGSVFVFCIPLQCKSTDGVSFNGEAVKDPDSTVQPFASLVGKSEGLLKTAGMEAKCTDSLATGRGSDITQLSENTSSKQDIVRDIGSKAEGIDSLPQDRDTDTDAITHKSVSDKQLSRTGKEASYIAIRTSSPFCGHGRSLSLAEPSLPSKKHTCIDNSRDWWQASEDSTNGDVSLSMNIFTSTSAFEMDNSSHGVGSECKASQTNEVDSERPERAKSLRTVALEHGETKEQGFNMASIHAQGTNTKGSLSKEMQNLSTSLLPERSNLHILLAEDNSINQKVACRQLERHGYKVTVASNGLQAFQAVCNDHDQFDIVLMDVQMPLMDGLEATTAIRAEERSQGWRRLLILGLTAHAIQGYEKTCLSHGMDGYLGKPFNIKQLLSVIHKHFPESDTS